MTEIKTRHDTRSTEKPKVKAANAKPHSSGRGTRVAIVLTLLLVVFGGGAWWYYDRFDGWNLGVTTERQAPEADGNKLVSPEETTIADVVDKVSPSIVSIVTQVESGSAYWGRSLRQGAGSGMIVGSNGYILTNKHVVDGARELQVVLGDGTTYDDVEIIVVDPLNDLAFLRIKDVSDLPVVDLGDSTTIRVGQRAIAIGNSLGQYQNTVTSGIISATGRPVSAQGSTGSVETLTDLLQTDAAINPGNSGGPLLNTSGQVIGVNTAIAADAEGIGFAIPINAAKGLLKQVLAGQEAQRAYLGIRYLPLDAALAKQNELDVSRGAFVTSESNQPAVMAGGPADAAGIRSGDVITKIGDVEVGPRGGVSSLIAEYAPGDQVKITLLRDGKNQVVTVTLGAYPS